MPSASQCPHFACSGQGHQKGAGFQSTRGKSISEMSFPRGRCLGRGDWRNTTPYDSGTLMDLGFAFTDSPGALFHALILQKMLRWECRAEKTWIKHNLIQLLSARHQRDFPPSQDIVLRISHLAPSFVSSRLDQNPSTSEKLPAIQTAPWSHGLKWTISGRRLLRHASMTHPPPTRAGFRHFSWRVQRFCVRH
jgi:hypothetical protein